MLYSLNETFWGKFFVLACLFLCVLFKSFGQQFNVLALQKIAQKESSKALQSKENVAQFLNKNSQLAPHIQLADGKQAVLVDIINGYPQYMITHNLEARQTTGVEYIQSSAGLGLSLLGNGIAIGVWDGGLVLNSHQEFQGRITNKVGTEVSNHATHVTGTIAASGVNSEAKGMLPAVAIDAYYAFENDLGPMAAAAANGLILSNHSYGLALGWNFNSNTQSWQWFGQSNGEDNRFGSYTANSRSIDNIAYNAPYYTIVWSAGNDRSDVGDGSRPPDGLFDLIGPAAAAKNVITVGAITGFENYVDASSAIISSFSSFGPTNDGRIKPDLVADGVGLVSTGSSGDDTYVSLSGTSMSAPNVTGSLGVLQQYYRQLSDTFMTAAQLKSLAIHTAREAGNNNRPDYQYGWGVLDAGAAIEMIAQRNEEDTLLINNTLSNGELHEYAFIPNTNQPFTATIAWTDVAGLAQQAGASDLALVNDLDIYIVDEYGEKIEPWILDPENRSARARQGNNSRDNVEKIQFQPAEVKKYRLIVKHKGNLENGSQAYALTISYGSIGLNTNDLSYWVDQDGVLNDGQNLATNSGQESEPMDISNLVNLVIDDNSFTDQGGTIQIDADLSFESILFLSEKKVILDLKGNTLRLNKGVFAFNKNLFIENGTLIIDSQDNNNLPLNFNGLNNLSTELCLKGKFEITTDISISNLRLCSGNFTINNKTLSLDFFEIGDEASVNISNSEILVQNQFQNLGESGAFNNNQWTLLNASINATANVFYNDTFQFEETSAINGAFKAKALKNMGKLTLAGRVTIDSLIIFDSTTLLMAHDSLFINKAFELNGTEEKAVYGAGASGNVKLVLNYRKLICFDNVEIGNVDLVSESILNVDPSSELIKTTNISQKLCENLIFPDFELSAYCESGIVPIINKSIGAIEAYSWNFGNDKFFDSVKSEENPVIWFDSPGSYEVTLTVSRGTDSHTYSRAVEITRNTLTEVNIVDNALGLVATTIADNYQWFYNGLVIEGANERILSNVDMAGIYNVAYFSEESTCGNRVSGPYDALVTSNTSRFSENTIIYPNPAKHFLNIESDREYNRIVIFDSSGSVVFENNLADAKNLEHVDISQLSTGLFVLKLHGKKGSEQLKFIIR